MSTFYVVKCLDALEYERWLSRAKTNRLDGVSDERFAISDEPGMEYVWNWKLTEDTFKFPIRWQAQALLEARCTTYVGLKMWIAKVDVP